MAFLTSDSLDNLLEALPLVPGDTLLVHASLAALGPWRGVAPSDIPDAAIQALRRRLGPRGTLVMPTFAYDFPQTHRCDLRVAPSTVGVLTERFREWPGTLRSTHPMFSFAANGPGAKVLLRPEQPEWHPFGPESVFARLHAANALVLLLGAEFRTCTAFVYSERFHGVPYRFDKSFAGEVTAIDGKVHEGNFFHFCLPRSVTITPDYSRAKADLLASGIAQRRKAGLGTVSYFRAGQVQEFLGQQLSVDPWYLLSNAPEVIVRYEDGVEIPMAPRVRGQRVQQDPTWRDQPSRFPR